jgi:hypothetical protein
MLVLALYFLYVIRLKPCSFTVRHTTWCETPTWSASLRELVSRFASTASKIWERPLPRSSVLGWNFPMSHNRCTVEVNVFELGTRYKPVWKRFPV